MAVNDNLNTQRPAVGRPGVGGGTSPVTRPGAPVAPQSPPQPQAPGQGSPHRITARPDQALIAIRPQNEADKQRDVLAAVRAAQGYPPEAPKPAEDEAPTAKKVADAVGIADGVREGTRIATNADELARLPMVGKAVGGGSRIGRFFSRIAQSKAGQAIALAMKEHRLIAPAARFLGRVAPIAGMAVAGYDIYDANKTLKDPKASTTEKVLSSAKATLSGIAGTAGVATLALAPTGVGAAIAGGIAIGAGLLSLGADLWLGKVRKDRQEAGK